LCMQFFKFVHLYRILNASQMNMKTAKCLLTLLAGIFLSGFAVNAQITKMYEPQWKKIDSLAAKGLPKSALAEVKKVYALAKMEGQEAQVVKALIYQTGLQQQTREANEVQAIKEIETELKEHKEPALSILHSYLAGLYWQYFQRNRWKFYDRTQTANFSKEDISTWTAEDFHAKITSLYLASLNNEKLLQATKLTPYEAIILKGNVRHLRPALYDLLAHKALEYFENDEREISKPAYVFEIDSAAAFAPAAQFAAARFATKDTLSVKHKALTIYQELLRFHLNDAKPDALMDVDLARLQYVKNHSTLPNANELYREALKALTEKYGHLASASQAWYLLAAYHEEQAAQYDPIKDTTHRYERIKARSILDRVVKDSTGKTEGWANSYNLLQEIIRPTFSFEVEKVNVPGQPFRALVRYKNVPALHLRLVKASKELKEQLQQGRDEQYWNALVGAGALQSWTQTLPPTNDLQQHAVEIKIDGLPVGEYLLLASSVAGFDKKTSPLGAQLFYVSNISFVNEGDQFFVLHRESGQPLAGAKVQVYQQKYDYATYKYKRAALGNYTADKNGYLKVNKESEERSNGYLLDISYGKDQLNMDDLIYRYYYYDGREETAKDNKHIFFFTDRALYRPGQTVYFKGIVVNGTGKEHKIVTDYKTTVYLKDANGQEVDSLHVTTNEFGSFTGKFQLPQNLLNGEFTIRDKGDENATAFSVEEYKRPKFLVEFEAVKESYKAGDSVTVMGQAKAYAGNVVDGAKVVYRVVREPRFLYPWLYWRWLPRTAPMEITHGEATTDKAGSFTITFKAIPDLSIDKKLNPMFDYRVYADVTDRNGETRSAKQVVSAGYTSLVLKVGVGEKLTPDSLKKLSIRTENVAGVYQPATVTVSIAPLVAEKRLIRERYWQEPDQFVMSKEEFVRFFPHDEFKGEGDIRTWPKGQVVYTRTDTTSKDAPFTIDQTFDPGLYMLEVSTKDKDGVEVKDVRYIELFESGQKELSRPQYLWTRNSERPIEPGEKTTIQVGTSAPNVFLVQEVDKQGGKPSQGVFSFSALDQGKNTFDFTATEEDRGGYGVTYLFVKDNRVYQFNDIVSVPWTNKALKIEYATFRDKTLPGSEERWKVKLSGYKNEKVAAEMLASMYDASLDQFRMHRWNLPGIWPVYARNFVWSSGRNFSAVQSQQKWVATQDYRKSEKHYDQLVFNHYMNLYKETRVRLRGEAARLSEVQAMSAPPATDAAANKLQGKVAGIANQETMQKMADTVVTDLRFPGQPEAPVATEIQIRKNLQETAFFFPDLHTDKEGNIEFSFTTPEALTRWKLQTLAHTQELAMGVHTKEIVTQKELMVQPAPPRFLRQGDRLEFTAKIVNLTDKELTGQAELQLVDATTNRPVDGWFMNTFPNQYFTVGAGQSEVVRFPMEVPYQFTNALVWRVVARAGNYNDGEEAMLPVLSNKIMVTETLPLPVRGSTTKNFTFDKLLKAGESETLQHHALTVEYTTNPAWYAVQALPYLMEYPYDCAEQVWNRYYANALATMITNSSPRIKEIFEQWKTVDTAALLSNLQRNQELKSALLEETPWVLQAKSETKQKKNLALLFDMVRMSSELKGNLEKLKSLQSENGGFVWFQGGPDDRYMTQYIVTGIGHLKKLKALTMEQEDELNDIVSNALPYLTRKLKEDYDHLVKNKVNLKEQHLGYLHTQYLYLRSFFPQYEMDAAAKTAYTYFYKQAQQFWVKGNKYTQGMVALALHRTGDKQTPQLILKSLKETAIIDEEQGMYWKDNTFGRSWFWWQAPIETQALLIEAFSDIGQGQDAVDDLRTWLLKNKQTNNWRTTKASAEACYALLLQGTDWLSNEPEVTVKLGSTTLSSKEEKTEAGTGNFKKIVESDFVKPDMGNITVLVQSPVNTPPNAPNSTSWGAVYWQYFEEMGKISPAATPLQLTKKLFIEKNTDRGPVLTPVGDGATLAVGDKVKVRIELRVDRDMEYVHMKDLRASALEPVNVISAYKWQGGLGYYESTKDASTNFFFNYLRKGTYVFEYPLFVTHTGTFSNGITSIQCLYAPEFSAHSEGVKITVE
jgi:hypothetical protein